MAQQRGLGGQSPLWVNFSQHEYVSSTRPVTTDPKNNQFGRFGALVGLRPSESILVLEKTRGAKHPTETESEPELPDRIRSDPPVSP